MSGHRTVKCLYCGWIAIAMVALGGMANAAYALTPDQIVTLEPGTERYSLGPHLFYLEDPDGSLAIEDVAS